MSREKMESYDQVVSALDDLLAEASRLTVELRDMEAELERRLAEVRAEYGRSIDWWKTELGRIDKAIKKLAKQNDGVLFPAEEAESWVRLRNGTLIRTIEERVKRARGVLERLEALGKVEAIKVAKSVDWSKLEAWPDEDLAVVGTERVVRVRYGYDVGASHEPQAKAAG